MTAYCPDCLEPVGPTSSRAPVKAAATRADPFAGTAPRSAPARPPRTATVACSTSTSRRPDDQRSGVNFTGQGA